MKLSRVKRTEMDNIDMSGIVKYSAVIDNKIKWTMETDGIFHPHITKTQFKELIKSYYETK